MAFVTKVKFGPGLNSVPVPFTRGGPTLQKYYDIDRLKKPTPNNGAGLAYSAASSSSPGVRLPAVAVEGDGGA